MSNTIKLVDQASGKEFEIPSEGSLGLLALGAVAVKPWREKRIASGFEAKLLERVKKSIEEQMKKKEEMKQKREEAKLKKEQEDGQKTS